MRQQCPRTCGYCSPTGIPTVTQVIPTVTTQASAGNVVTGGKSNKSFGYKLISSL